MSQPIDKRVTVRLDPDLAAQLDDYLKTSDRALTRSEVIRDALHDYLTRPSAHSPGIDSLLHLILRAQLQLLQRDSEHDSEEVKKALLRDAKRWRSQQAKMVDYLTTR